LDPKVCRNGRAKTIPWIPKSSSLTWLITNPISAVIKVIDNPRWSRDLITDPITSVVIYPISSTKVIRRIIKVVRTVYPIVRAVIKIIRTVDPVVRRVIKVDDPLGRNITREDRKHR
jgi:hypothetical protein